MFKEILEKAFGGESVEPPSKVDAAKVQAIIDNKDYPAVAPAGKAFVVQWADGRAVFAIRSKAGLKKWLTKAGNWAEIISIKYGNAEFKDKPLKITESIQIKSFDAYSKLVAKAYEAAPAMDPKAVPAWKALITHIETLFKRLTGIVKVEWVEQDPYPNAEVMKQQVKATKVLKIWKGGTGHPTWTHEQNLKFRAVHDYYSHIISGQPFGVRGEIKAYNTHAKMCPPAALPALFTEIVGQACTAVVTGGFPEQKIALLPGFDYVHIGKVAGHDIVNKELVPKVEPQAKPTTEKPVPQQLVAASERAYGPGIMEQVFTSQDLDLDKTYGVFKASYEKQTGKAWDKEKFLERIENWTLYGDPDGFVAARAQASGPIKMVGAAGNPAGVKKGFQELLATGKPVWGAMDMRLASMAARMGMKMPPAWIMVKILTAIKDRFAQASGLEPGAVQVNKDGSLTLDYPDIGKATKFVVGNKAYFEWLLKTQGSAIPAMLRTAVSYFLTTGKPPPEQAGDEKETI